ncbi:FdtA/QdtA family cupin domain-containing protein [Kocuria sp.]|uniref:FdtA/QdtA family cupin domain-containing protein n=1 Tax=Kocuria sp. TaxID=1871328 RepID=UPI0034CDFC3C
MTSPQVPEPPTTAERVTRDLTVQHPWSIIDVGEILDERGCIVVVPDGLSQDPDFDLQRVYFLYTEREDVERGNHAHRRLHQLILCLHGSMTVELDDGSRKESFLLNSRKHALKVGPLVWRRLHSSSPGSICAVLASLPYDPDDYISSYDEFRLATAAIGRSAT